MRVLLLNRGYPHEVGSFFWNSLLQLGIPVDCLDTRHYYPKGTHRLHFAYIKLLNIFGLKTLYNRNIILKVSKFKPDLVLVVKGNEIYPETLEQVKQNSVILANYATDDPYNKVVSSEDLRKSIPYYDFYFCTKRAIMDDVRKAGCRNVFFLPFGYDPRVHFPEYPKNKNEASQFHSDIVFVGGADEDRISIMESIKKVTGIRLHLYGGYWGRSLEFRDQYKGYAYGRDYRLSMTGSKMALGLVRKSNRDGHSMRTFEIPACNTFFIGERLDEQQEFLVEDVDCVYFSSTEELIQKIKFYNKHYLLREKIKSAGYRKIINSKNSYLDRLKQIMVSVVG